MKTLLSIIAASSLALVSTGSAGAPSTYQVTGPVVEVSDTVIVLTKGATKERFEIARNADTKVTGELKVGAKVTVMYSMTATSVEVKVDKADKAAKAPKADKAAKPAASPK